MSLAPPHRSVLTRFVSFVTRTRVRDSDPVVLRKARLLAACSASMMPLFAALDGWLLWQQPGYRPPYHAYPVLLGAYLFNRLGWYRPAAVLVSGVTSYALFGQLWLDRAANPALTLSYAPVSILLGTMFLSLRGVAALSAANVLGILALPWYAPQFQDAPTLALPLTSTAICGAAAVLYMLHRDALEADRQRELVRSESRLQAALAVARMGHWEWDVRRDAMQVSESLERIFGLEPGAFGKTFADYTPLVHPDDLADLRAVIEGAIEGNASHLETVHRVVRPGGELRTIEARGVVQRNAAGVAVYMTGTVVDISERRLLEEQLRQAQKMEAVGRLAGGIAHDFNNMLTVISGNAALLERHVERRELAEIQNAVQAASTLTRQLLAFSRRAMLRPSVLDLGDVIRDSADMLRRIIGEDVRVEIREAPALWNVRVDRAQVQEMLLNLATNSRDAMPSGGTLILETENRGALSFISHDGESRSGDYVMLSVTDTGEGMDEATLSHMFEPFFTTKEVGKGTGLGLSMVFGGVTQSEGHVEIESQPGVGTSVRLLFPRSRAPREHGTAHAQPRPERGSETVLLVEDEAAVRALCTEVLHAQGYRVLEAEHAAAARTLFADHADRIDLLLTDTVMPGESGPDLARALRREAPELSVIFMSGYADGGARDGNMRPDAEAFLAKPFSPDELLRQLRRTLDRRAVRPTTHATPH